LVVKNVLIFHNVINALMDLTLISKVNVFYATLKMAIIWIKKIIVFNVEKIVQNVI
jgi:hypothetical protein